MRSLERNDDVLSGAEWIHGLWVALLPGLWVVPHLVVRILILVHRHLFLRFRLGTLLIAFLHCDGLLRGVPTGVANRTGLWAHVYVNRAATSPDPASKRWKARSTAEAHTPLISYVPKKKVKATKNLLDLRQGPVYRAFRRSPSAHAALLRSVEPYLLSGQLASLTPTLLLDFARHCHAQGRLRALESCLLSARPPPAQLPLVAAVCARLRTEVREVRTAGAPCAKEPAITRVVTRRVVEVHDDSE